MKTNRIICRGYYSHHKVHISHIIDHCIHKFYEFYLYIITHFCFIPSPSIKITTHLAQIQTQAHPNKETQTYRSLNGVPNGLFKNHKAEKKEYHTDERIQHLRKHLIQGSQINFQTMSTTVSYQL